MAVATHSIRPTGFAATERRDAWWVAPLVQGLLLATLVFLWRDVFEATRFGSGLGIGVGTLVLLINTSALTLYSFSCHSARHLVGGTLDCFSCGARARVRHSAWRGASALNEHHMAFAWISFVAVCAADLYVRLVAAGVIGDLRLL